MARRLTMAWPPLGGGARFGAAATLTLLTALTGLVSLTLIGTTAKAQGSRPQGPSLRSETEPAVPETATGVDSEPSAAHAAHGTPVRREPLEWWPWAAVAPALGVALTLELAIDADEPRWTRVGLIDESVDHWPRETRAGRQRASLASDVLLYSLFAAPVLDAVLWREGQSPSRDTYRLLTADALAFASETVVAVATKVAFRRARPYVGRCGVDADYADCESERRNRSFVSGHAAAAFTGASLVCAHQRLRGQRPLGRLECVAALALASLTGALRVVSDNHYLSDVVAGAVLGFLAGFVVPIFVYPRTLSRTESRVSTPRRAW